MERIFRKHFWAVHLLVIFLLMVLVARILNQFVEMGIAPEPSAKPISTTKAKAPEPPALLNLERMAKLTGLALPEPEPLVKEPSAPVVDLTSDPVHTTLKVKLLGTLVASVPEWSISSIQDTQTQKNQTYMIGDLVQGAQILDIERLRVIVLNNNRREFIDGNPGDGSTLAVAAAPPQLPTPSNSAPGPAGAALGTGIRKTGENEYEVPRAEIDRTLSNLNDVAMQARIVPHFKDGAATGFKVFSIQKDSIYSKIGIQNGDVIRRINGYEMNSPEKALEIYTKLKEANRIDIEKETSSGSIQRNTYNIR